MRIQKWFQNEPTDEPQVKISNCITTDEIVHNSKFGEDEPRVERIEENENSKFVEKDLTDDRTAHSKFIQNETVDVLDQTLIWRWQF